MNTARVYMGSDGLQTAALAFGGSIPPSTNVTESYNGTNWTNEPALATATNFLMGTGTQSSALKIGGSPQLTSTEEFTGAAPVTKTITAS